MGLGKSVVVMAFVMMPVFGFTIRDAVCAAGENVAADVDPKALFDEGATALLEGDYEEAVERFAALEDAAEAKPGGDALASLLERGRRAWASALIEQGQFESAEKVLESAAAFDSSPTLLAARGRLHVRRGQLKAAQPLFRRALEIDPRHVESIVWLGSTLASQGLVAAAETEWNKIIEIYEQASYEDVERMAPEVLVDMGRALIGLNRYKEANSVMFEQAQEKDDSNPELLLAQAQAFLDKYNYPDSRDCVRDLLDLNPNSADALALLADNYLVDFQVGTKRYDLAQRYVERALEVNPRHARAHLVKGLLALSDGRLDAARKDFVRSVELNPSSLRARGLVATCDHLLGRTDAVEAAASEALELNPRGAEFFHTIAVAIETKFRYAETVKFCDLALEVDPNYWPAYATVGVNCMRTGEEERGRSFLEKSWAQDKFNPWVFNTRLLTEHMDKNHSSWESEQFVFRVPKTEHDVLKTYLQPLLEEALDSMTVRYKTKIKLPVYIEAFSAHKWFSARTIGLEGLAAAGACFGNLVTLATPRALPMQNWGAVAWHEFAHVITLNMTDNRVPRWLTEGLSVYEEGHDRPEWERNFDREVVDAYGSGRLLPIRELDFGFSKPKYPNQILMSYFQGCLVVRFIEKEWGFDRVLAILDGYKKHKSLEENFRDALSLSLDEFDRRFFAYIEAWARETGYQPALANDVIAPLELDIEIEADPKKLVDLAWAYLMNNGPIEEDSKFTAAKVLEKDPDNADAHFILGMHAHLKAEEPKTARQELERALEGGTRFVFRTHLALGEIAAAEKDTERARDHYEKAKRTAPRAAATFGGTNVYYRLFELDKDDDAAAAVVHLEELSRHAPEDGKCRFLIAQHYLSAEGETKAAASKVFRALNEAIYVMPYDLKLHQRLAAAAAELNRYDVAIREHLLILKYPDADPQASYEALAEAYLASGDRRGAAGFARKVLELDQGHDRAAEILRQAESEAQESPNKAR